MMDIGIGKTSETERLAVWVSVALALLAAAIALVTTASYALDLASLIRLRPDWRSMSISTALMCFGLSVALMGDALGRRRIAKVAGIAALISSAVLLGGGLVTGHDVVSPTLLGLLGNATLGGSTSDATAFCTGLLAVASLSRPRRQPAAGLAVAVMLIAGLAVLGYTYGVKDLYALSPFRTMSLRTALSLLALGTGFLLANREARLANLIFDRGQTGRATRRQLGFLVFPPCAAYLLLQATSADRLGAGAAMAFLVVLTIAPLALLILRDARGSMRLEIERSGKRRADKAKLTIERRYRTLFTRLETGFCVIEVLFDEAAKPVDYRFLEVNPAFASQSGLNDAEGRLMRDLAPGHDQHWFDIYGRVALTGEPVRFEQEATALGRYFDVSAFRIDEPEAHHVAILFSDVTARRRAELDMKALNETLERRVAERAAELETTQEALRQSQKLEAIGQLTGGVAHDFNNLLTVITGSVEVLGRAGLSEERRTRFTKAIGEAAGRAATLTAQLLAFSRRQSLKPEIFDVGRSLSDVAGMLTALTGARINLELRLPDEAYFVHADRSQFDTAIVNMAVNARDAMDGVGRITIAVGPVSGVPAVRAHSPVAGDFIAVSISDTGTGIAPDRLGKIFEPFYTTKDVGTGTGLGLSQAIGFAKQSGGDIRVESEPGQGATFILYLPRDYAEIVPHRLVPGSEDDVAGDGLRVLIVEDNLQVGEFASQSLQELGYESELAPDAASGLALLTQGRDRFDVVFSDVVMPGGMNGVELGEEVRRLYPDLPVVLTSGYSHVLAQDGTHGFELLHKPYSIEQLSRVLRKSAAWAVEARKPGRRQAG